MKWIGVIFGVCVALLLFSAGQAVHVEGNSTIDFHWYMLDITAHGHYGDAQVFVDTVSRKVVMIDTGDGTEDMANLMMSNLDSVMTRHGFTQPYPIDSILITHPHFDHHGGLPYLLAHPEKYKIGQIWWHDYARIKSYCWAILTCYWIEDAIKRAEALHVPIHGYSAEEFKPIKFSNGIEITAPLGVFYFDNCITKQGELCKINNLSFVTKLNVGNVSALLTGDQEQAESLWMLAQYPASLLHSDILKAPHHLNPFAQNSDPKWYQTVAPRHVISSTTKTQWCKKDAEAIHDLLKSMGMPIYITTVHGEIHTHFTGPDATHVTYTVQTAHQGDIWTHCL